MENLNDSKVVEVINYYNTWTKKFIDFLIGFVGYILFAFLVVKFTGVGYLLILLFVTFVVNTFFLKTGRRFIKNGITSGIILTFVVFFIFIIIVMSGFN